MHFWAGWCEPCTLLDRVLTTLGGEAPGVALLHVEAEEVPDVSEACSVAAVPLFLFYRGGKQVDRLEGADAAALTEKFRALTGAAAPSAAAAAAAAPPSVSGALGGAR